MEILYCDRCGVRVPEKDLEDGRATRNETSVVCAQCNKIKTVKPVGPSRSSGAHLLPGASKTEKRSEVAVKPAQKSPVPAGSAAAHRPSTVTRAEDPKSAQTTLLIVVGVLVLIVGGLLMFRSGEKPAANAPAKPESPPLASHGPALKPALPTPIPPATKTITEPFDRPPPPPDTAASPEEKEAQAAYEALLRFEGLTPEDSAGKLLRIDAFVAKYGDTLQAARVRVLADEYRNPKPPAPVVEAPLTPNADVKYGADPPFSMNGCRMIWFPEDNPPAETRYFRRVFELPAEDGIKSASMLVTCDDQFVLFLNGTKVALTKPNVDAWREFQWADLTAALRLGRNFFAAACTNTGGPAAFVARLKVELASGAIQTIDSDASWKSSNREQESWTKDTFDDKDWVAAKDLSAYTAGWERTTFPDRFTFVAKGPPLVSFLKFDAATKGNWKGVYGADGYSLCTFNAPALGLVPANTHDLGHLPDYVAEFKKEGHSAYSGKPDDALSLLSPDGAKRALACDFSETTFTYSIKLKEKRPFRLTLYCWDFDGGRKQRVEVLDAEKDTVLNAQELESFQGGLYHVWEIRSASVRIRFTNKGNPNAVCSGIFFDSIPGEPAVVAGAGKTPATSIDEPKPAKQPDPKASADALFTEIELYLKSSRWKEALEKVECLISSPPDGKLTDEQKAKAEGLRAKARGELASSYLRADRVKLGCAKRQLPDGRWEFIYDFRNPAQKFDFHAPPQKIDLDKGELFIVNIDIWPLIEFCDDLDISYEAATVGAIANRIHLHYYNHRGEFGASDNTWTGVWRAVPEGWLKPLARNNSLTIVPGKWHKIGTVFETKTKTTTISIDGKQGLKFTDPSGAGKGPVYLGCYYAAKFRNLSIRGTPTLESLERAEQTQKYASELSRKFASGQPLPILTKNDEPYWHGSGWKLTGDETAGSGGLWLPGLASSNYELNFECRRIDSKELQIYFRADSSHSWHATLYDGGIVARVWDHANGKEARLSKAVACDSTAFHKIQAISRGKNLKVVMDDKEVLFDVKDVPLDAAGPYWISLESKSAVRKAVIRYLP